MFLVIVKWHVFNFWSEEFFIQFLFDYLYKQVIVFLFFNYKLFQLKIIIFSWWAWEVGLNNNIFGRVIGWGMFLCVIVLLGKEKLGREINDGKNKIPHKFLDCKI